MSKGPWKSKVGTRLRDGYYVYEVITFEEFQKKSQHQNYSGPIDEDKCVFLKVVEGAAAIYYVWDYKKNLRYLKVDTKHKLKTKFTEDFKKLLD